MAEREHPVLVATCMMQRTRAMSNSNRPLSALPSQPHDITDASDPHSSADRRRLDQSLQKYLRYQGISDVNEQLDSLCPSTGGALWTAVRVLQDQVKIERERKRIIEACESPIERQLVEPLLLIAYDMGCSVSYKIGGWESGEILGTSNGGHLCIEPQCEVPPYRVDFMIAYTTEDYGPRVDAADRRRRFHTSYLAIECDGRLFHDLKPAQKERDRRKTRDLYALGYQLYPISGVQITRSPYSCAYKSLRALIDRHYAERLADAA